MSLYIKVGSVTNAQRGLKLLRSKGYKVQMKRIENPSKADGCGYALEVSADDDVPVKLLEKGRISVRGVDIL